MGQVSRVQCILLRAACLWRSPCPGRSSHAATSHSYFALLRKESQVHSKEELQEWAAAAPSPRACKALPWLPRPLLEGKHRLADAALSGRGRRHRRLEVGHAHETLDLRILQGQSLRGHGQHAPVSGASAAGASGRLRGRRRCGPGTRQSLAHRQRPAHARTHGRMRAHQQPHHRRGRAGRWCPAVTYPWKSCRQRWRP